MASGSGSAASGSSQVSLDAVLREITTSQDDKSLNTFLKEYGREMRDMLYASLLSSGQDPLSVLDVHVNTLGYLYLLSARLSVPNAPIPPLAAIQQFCKEFDPVKARLAPERITMLARGIVYLYETSAEADKCIPLLFDILTRYPPTLNHLTTIHSIFLRVCVATKRFAAALPVLEVPITEIEPTLSDLHYNDNIVYHYAGGMAFAALKRWAAAEEFFEIVVGSPAHIPSAVQFEALKKLALVQLILYGKLKEIPKYVNPTLVNVFKKSPYIALVNNYPLQSAHLEKLIEKEASFFDSDKNLGLVRQALDRARRWSIKRLTGTYIALSLVEIGNAVSLQDAEAVRAIIVSMIEDGEISGSIAADGTVTFDDAVPNFNKAQIEQLLASTQQQGANLVAIDTKISRSREFLFKSLQRKEQANWGDIPDEDMFGKQAETAWAEEL